MPWLYDGFNELGSLQFLPDYWKGCDGPSYGHLRLKKLHSRLKKTQQNKNSKSYKGIEFKNTFAKVSGTDVLSAELNTHSPKLMDQKSKYVHCLKTNIDFSENFLWVISENSDFGDSLGITVNIKIHMFSHFGAIDIGASQIKTKSCIFSPDEIINWQDY